jgi:hypothetical protein
MVEGSTAEQLLHLILSGVLRQAGDVDVGARTHRGRRAWEVTSRSQFKPLPIKTRKSLIGQMQ